MCCVLIEQHKLAGAFTNKVGAIELTNVAELGEERVVIFGDLTGG